MTPTFESFYEEYITAKRLKKYHKMMEYIHDVTSDKKTPKYIIIREYDENEIAHYHTYDECSQIAVSMCLKSLPRDRAEGLCVKLFPTHDTQTIMDASYHEGNVPSEHIVYGYDMSARGESGNAYRKAMERFNFNEDHVMSLVNELTLVELANLVPRIEYVTYQIVSLL